MPDLDGEPLAIVSALTVRAGYLILETTMTITREQFEQEYTKHFSATCALMNSKCFNIDTANDLAQDAWTLAWAKREQFRGESQFNTWVHSIAINVWLVWLRKQKLHDTEQLDDNDVPVPPVLPADTSREQWIRAQINTLNEKHRKVMLLTLAGRTDMEIWRWNHIPKNTTKTIRYRVIEQLRHRLVQGKAQAELVALAKAAGV